MSASNNAPPLARLTAKRNSGLLLVLSAVAMLGACGKKGDLELPPREAAPSAEEQPGGDTR